MSEQRTLEELEQAVKNDPETSQPVKDLLRTYSVQLEYSLNAISAIIKKLDNLEVGLVTLNEILKKFRSTLTKQVYSCPNTDNKVESSNAYLHLENISLKKTNPDYDPVRASQRFYFSDPAVQEMYNQVTSICKKVNPRIVEADIFDLFVKYY